MADPTPSALSTASTAATAPSTSSGTAAGGASATAAKVSAFQLALQNAMNQTPPLTDGGGTDDNPDDGTSLSIRMGVGFPMP